MKQLFTMDIKDYGQGDGRRYRASARAVIRAENGRIAMVYSRKYKYYKFPGGGIQADEKKEDALAREVHEETGLIVKKDTIQEYGSVRRLQKSSEIKNTVFVQENFYYICGAEMAVGEQRLDGYEQEAEFEPQYIYIEDAIKVNKLCAVQDAFTLVSVARDTAMLEILDGTIPNPSIPMAKFLLRTAAKSNPGPWEQHSRYVAESARKIAEHCPGMDGERAYVYGMLHDIGRKFGVSCLAHVYDGYHYLLVLGYGNAAGIALSHSFNRKEIDDYIGEFDITEDAQEEIRCLLKKVEFNDYDYLIQLCDSIAKADGIVSLEERMTDVKNRYGHYPQEKWEKNVELKDYFEEKMGKNLYTVVDASL